MRVLHVIPSIDPRDGGPTVAVASMATATAVAGAEVHVVTTRGDAAQFEAGRALIDLDAVTLHAFRRSPPATFKMSWAMARWLWKNVERFSVVHLHAAFSLSTSVAARIAWSKRVPYVLRPLGTLDPWSLREKAWKKAPYYRLVEKATLIRASAIHATSQLERDGIASLGFADKTVVIPLGVSQASRVAVPPPDHKRPLRLLFVGRLHPIKGLPLLLDALTVLKGGRMPFALRIAGQGTPAYRRELVESCHTRGLDQHVSFLGHITGREKDEQYAWADALVLPSFHENFGIAVAEAMSAGLMVVVTDRVGLAGVVARWRAGIVVPCRIDALVDALRSLSDDRKSCVDMGKRAQDAATAEFSWAAVSKELLAMYDDLRQARAIGT
jgi:glycosyltransferase involved in cell wall biosynthesis